MNTLVLILYTILLAIIFIMLLLKGMNLNININVKQTFDAEELEKLQDIYDTQGNLKKEFDMSTVDEVIHSINDFMTGGDANEQEAK